MKSKLHELRNILNSLDPEELEYIEKILKQRSNLSYKINFLNKIHNLTESITHIKTLHEKYQQI